jgi:hypothetical protein
VGVSPAAVTALENAESSAPNGASSAESFTLEIFDAAMTWPLDPLLTTREPAMLLALPTVAASDFAVLSSTG